MLEGVAAKNRKHNAHIPARSATMSHTSAKGAFTCSMWHAHTRARPHTAQLCTCSRFARNSRLEPQLTLRGRHCCNEGGLLSILVRWIGDRSSSTPTRAAQLGVPTPTTARRLVDQDAPRIQRGSFAPTELPASGLGCSLCAAPATRAISAARRGRRPSAELKRATLAYV